MVEILLADDHELLRMGLRLLLQMQKDWHVCGEARDGREAVTLAARLNPTVAIVDLQMPDIDGLEVARGIRDVSPQTQVLLFTGFGSTELAEQAHSAGARGLVLKSEGSLRVVTAVRSMIEESSPSRDPGAHPGRHPLRRLVSREPRDELTPREREVAQLLAEGKSNRCVSLILGISVKTVETHRSNIMKKLHLESVVELVHYAVRKQLVTP